MMFNVPLLTQLAGSQPIENVEQSSRAVVIKAMFVRPVRAICDPLIIGAMETDPTLESLFVLRRAICELFWAVSRRRNSFAAAQGHG